MPTFTPRLWDDLGISPCTLELNYSCQCQQEELNSFVDLVSQARVSAIDPKTSLLRCEYTSDVSTGLAAGSIIFLMFSQIIIMLATRCLCCGSGVKPGGAKTFGVLMFLLSWYAASAYFELFIFLMSVAEITTQEVVSF